MNLKPVYISIDNPISLEGHGVVKNEAMDIAAIKLGISTVERIKDNVLFVTSDLVNNPPLEGCRRRSEVVGFPSNRNTMKTRKHRIGKNILRYTANDVSDKFFPDDEYVEGVHFALECDEKAILDNELRKTQPRKMEGVSGGPISEIFWNDTYVSGRIQGVLLGSKKAKGALVGLRYEYILAWLEENFGAFPEAPR